MRRRSSRWWPFSQLASFSGGKKGFAGQQALGLFEYSTLVAFEAEEVIGSQFLSNKTATFLLAGLAITATTAAQHLAVNGQARQHRNLLFQQPTANDLFKVLSIQSIDHPEEGRITRSGVMPLLIGPAAQRPQLPLRQLAARILKGLVPCGAHQRRHRRTRQHIRLAMT